MSESDSKNIELLKNEISQLKKLLLSKDQEVQIYKQEFLKFSHQLDQVMIQLSSDVDLLKKIQKVLTPTEIPNIPGFEFSRKFVYGTRFGGDYFDIFEHEDKLKFGILISASTGYAMSALFLSLVLKMTHLLEAKKGIAPNIVLKHINDELKTTAVDGKNKKNETKNQDQAHTFYGVIDRRDLSLSFCATGLIKGFFQTQGQSLQLISSGTEGLGIDTQPEFKTLKIDLEPKSRLVLFTPGISDILTLEQISQCLIKSGSQTQVHDVRNEILLQCQLVSGLENPLRDQTVVVMDVKDRVIKLAK